MSRKMQTMDGNMAAAHVSYAFTETAGIYPITPSSDMAEHTDSWAAYGKKNIFGETVKVVEMQSEGGASGVVHGALQAGALTTTYTASQGLLLMIPNMYKMAGELLPAVLHVSARTLASHALSIFGEHSDVYAARATGFAMLASSSVQEVMDLGALAHLAAIKGRVPFLHFFDGFRTSHEIQKIEVWDYETLAKMVDYKALKEFRDRALNPEHPVTRGTAQNPDIFFQAREASNVFYNKLPDVVEGYMKEISKATGRDYKLFNYYGDERAERVIIAMGSVNETIKETIDYLNAKGEKVGLVLVRLYRPFSAKHFLEVLPKTVKKIAVLDRSKECGATGEPLYLDVRSVLYDKKDAPIVVGGRYGLSSKDTNPAQIVAVYANLAQSEPKNGFTIGINDDVTFTSLPVKSDISTMPAGTVECKFYGLGADGTVGANKNSIKIIGDHTDMYAQGYFAYDSKKSGGITISHLRFGKQPIRSTYFVINPSFVSCSTPSYMERYDMLRGIRKGGVFLLNSIWNKNEVIAHIPDYIKKQLVDNEIKMYMINATKIAEDLGLGNRTNTIMQSAFFKLTNVIPYQDAVKFMKDAIVKTYSKKGDAIVNMNNKAVDMGAEGLVEISIDPSWKNLKGKIGVAAPHVDDCHDTKLKNFVNNVATPVNSLIGDDLPVSAFVEADGTLPNGTSAYEKRGIAVNVPEWQSENCIQCNQCAYVCPHACIRPFLLDEKESAGAKSMKLLDAKGKGVEGYKFRIQISTLDCTGCSVCVNVCPSKEKSLIMKPLESQVGEDKNWDYLANSVTVKKVDMSVTTVKGSQFKKPYFEFSGACAGCGETPYVRTVTQLFGERMMIANATGCSSIYGGSAPATPYCKDSEGRGPAWGNSLFEDNAEYGMGMALGVDKLRSRIELKMRESLNTVSSELKGAFNSWLEAKEDGDKSVYATNALLPILEKDKSAVAKEILDLKQYLIKKSVWIIGGDGWAYDIGYGGLDHVLASGENVNVLVLDTEVYSNTGGQSSKSSARGSVAKFTTSGKTIGKKDLGRMAMTYGYVYVAQVAIGANQAQFLKVLAEAEAYQGPSLIIAYAPCIAHGIKGGMENMISQEKLAVESGYWHLYRYNPLLEKEGKNPFVLESKGPKFDQLKDFMMSEVRYNTLTKSFPDEATRLFESAVSDAKWRYASYKRMNDHY